VLVLVLATFVKDAVVMNDITAVLTINRTWNIKMVSDINSH